MRLQRRSVGPIAPGRRMRFGVGGERANVIADVGQKLIGVVHHAAARPVLSANRCKRYAMA